MNAEEEEEVYRMLYVKDAISQAHIAYGTVYDIQSCKQFLA